MESRGLSRFCQHRYRVCPRSGIAPSRGRRGGDIRTLHFQGVGAMKTSMIAVLLVLASLACCRTAAAGTRTRTSRVFICSPIIRQSRCGRAPPRPSRCGCRITACRPSAITLSVDGIAAGLDRDAARRRTAGRRRHAGDRPERQPSASPRRARQCRTERPDPDGEGGRAGQPGEPAAHHQSRQGIAGQA